MKEFIRLIVIFLLYFIAGRFGLQFADAHQSVTVIWAPTGIALAALLMYGYRVWPALFIGAFLVNATVLGVNLTTGLIAAGNTLEGFIGVYLVNRLAHGKNAFLRPTDIFRYTVLTLLSTTISPNIGMITLINRGYTDWSQFVHLWLTWWFGGFSGTLIVAPFLIFLVARHQLFFIKHRLKLEAVLAFLVLIFIALLLFGGTTSTYPLAFLSIPPIIWISFRFGRRETTTAILLLEGFGLWGTAMGYGPFARSSLNESLILLQAFMDVIALTALSLAVAVAQRREAQIISDQIKDEFISFASHELRTPTTAIRGLITMVLEGDYGKVQSTLKKPLEDIRTSSNRQIELINDLLDVSRLQAGRANYTLHNFPLNEVLENEVALLQPLTLNKNIQFVLKPKRNYHVQADIRWVKQVLNNLLGNALKYTESGTITVATDTDQERVFVSVSDTGSGIDVSESDKLFGRFRQLTSHGKTKPPGTGLGLYISRSFARKMGGDLYLERSVIGEGSTFVFTLPKAGSPSAKKIKKEITLDSA